MTMTPRNPSRASSQPGRHHDRDLGELADAHRRPDPAVRKPQHLAHERRRLHEVDLVDHRDRQTRRDQHRERSLAEQPEGLREGELLLRVPPRRRRRQEEAEQGVAEGQHAAPDQRIDESRRRVGSLGPDVERRQPGEPDVGEQPEQGKRPARRDPADRAPDPHLRELAVGVVQVREGERVRERQGRRVQHRVGHGEPEPGGERRLVRGDDLDRAAGQQQHRENALRRERAVGELTGDERRGDGADRTGQAQNPADLPGAEAEAALGLIGLEVAGQDRQPDAPDPVLQEHHDGQPEVGLAFHRKHPTPVVGAGAPASRSTLRLRQLHADQGHQRRRPRRHPRR